MVSVSVAEIKQCFVLDSFLYLAGGRIAIDFKAGGRIPSESDKKLYISSTYTFFLYFIIKLMHEPLVECLVVLYTCKCLVCRLPLINTIATH